MSETQREFYRFLGVVAVGSALLTALVLVKGCGVL